MKSHVIIIRSLTLNIVSLIHFSFFLLILLFQRLRILLRDRIQTHVESCQKYASRNQSTTNNSNTRTRAKEDEDE